MKRLKIKSAVLFGVLMAFTLVLSIGLIPTTSNITVQASSSPTASIFSFAAKANNEADVVLSDKTVRVAVVPAKTIINGTEYTVTGISNAGFANSSNLEIVRLPNTVKTIGMAAFMNCTKLESITLPAVEIIGANAFTMTSLEYLIIPQTVTTVGAQILRNTDTQVYVRASSVSTPAWNAQWNVLNTNTAVEYGSDFVPPIRYQYIESSSMSAMSTGITTMGAPDGEYWVEPYQPLTDFLSGPSNIYIPATYMGEPVTAIADNAFEWTSYDSITIGYSASPIRIGTMAFAGFMGGEITINREITFESDAGTLSELVFAMTSATTIVLPNTITAFGGEAFADCSSLTDIHFVQPETLSQADEEALASTLFGTTQQIVTLPDSVTEIGGSAFRGTLGLSQIHISENVTEVGSSAFWFWDAPQEIYVGHNQDSIPAGWDEFWTSGVANLSIIKYADQRPFTVDYDLQGGTHSGNPTEFTLEDTYFTLNDATRTGYIFDGWFNKADDQQVVGLPTDSDDNFYTSDLSLEAKWTAISYTITYDSNKPRSHSIVTGATGTSTHYFGTTSSLTPSGYNLIGWIANGWNTQPDGSGTSYVDGFNQVLNWADTQDTNITLYQQWVAKDYIINYEGNRGSASSTITGDTADSAHKYGTDSPVSANGFALVGWTFSHWNTQPNGDGESFYPGDMVNDLSDGGSIYLFAQWTQDSYSVVYDKNRPVIADASNSVLGTMENSIFKYDDVGKLRNNTYTLVNWVFKGWNTQADGSGKSYLNEQEDSNFTTGVSITLYAVWEQDTYTVVYEKNKPTSPVNSSHEVTGSTPASSFKYDENETLRINGFALVGWTFQGWATSANGSVVYPNEFAGVYNLGGLTLFAVWKQNTYTVVYDANTPTTSTHPVNASNIVNGTMANNVYEYDTSSTLRNNTFTLTGWTFTGWATSSYNAAAYSDNAVVTNWSLDNGEVIYLYARWIQNTYTVFLNKQSGTGGTDSVTAAFDDSMPWATRPSLTGYTFNGYFTGINGSGTQYYDDNMNSMGNWDKTGATTLYAKWVGNDYDVIYNPNGGSGTMDSTTHTNGIPSGLSVNTYTKTGYIFAGWNTIADGSGASRSDGAEHNNLVPNGVVTLYAQWSDITYTVCSRAYYRNENSVYAPSGSPWFVYGRVLQTFIDDEIFTYNTTATRTAPSISGYTFQSWYIYDVVYGYSIIDHGQRTSAQTQSMGGFTVVHGATIIMDAFYKEKETCVAEGTQITLADGTQKAVELLDGTEQLLVWNHKTGTFDSAPIVFVDAHTDSVAREVIHLYFSDGTEVKVLHEHAFWDFNLNRYVFIRNGESHQYIGHWFNKQISDGNGGLTWTQVQLTDVDIYTENVTAWSPVTFEHLNFYVNGLLSMPGATEGLINIFEVDATTMQYDQTAFAADIALYGVFTYDDFDDMIPEEIFYAFDAQYLTVSMGKGLIDWHAIEHLIEHYSEFFV